MVANFELANLKKRLIRRAEEKVLIADSTKFGKINIASIGNIPIFDKLFVDSSLPDELASKISGVDIL